MPAHRHPAHQATHSIPADWQLLQLGQRLAFGAPPLAFSCASIPVCLGTLLLCLLNGLLIAIVGWMLLFAFFGRPVSFIDLLCGWMPLWLFWNEGYWFGLTCRRFAQWREGYWHFYGAFGRVRLRIPAATPCTYWPRSAWLTVWPADGAVRTLSLVLCKDRARLAAQLSAHDTDFWVLRRPLPDAPRLPAWQVCAQICWLGLLVAQLLLVMAYAGSTWVLDISRAGWQGAVIWTVFFCLILPMLLGSIGPSRQSPLRPLWRYPRHVRHWRLYLAKAQFLGWTALLMAGGILLCSFMQAYSLTYLSLWWQPARGMHAEVTAALKSGRCRGGPRRYSYERWELKLRLPDAPVWNGTMLCSRFRTDNGPIPPGSRLTVQVKGNVWGQAIQIISQPRPPQQTAP